MANARNGGAVSRDMLAALVLASAITLTTPNPIYVKPGELLTVDIDIAPMHLIYGGHLRAENTSIAIANGAIPPGGSQATTTISGVRVGSTNLRLSFVSGISVYDYVIATIIVDACNAPMLTFGTSHLRVNERQPVSLQAMTSGTPEPDVHWYDGGVFIGIGNPLTVKLTRGVHRITAYGVNRCGMGASEMEIEVLGDRQRAVRH